MNIVAEVDCKNNQRNEHAHGTDLMKLHGTEDSMA